jgi:acyl carrier protein
MSSTTGATEEIVEIFAEVLEVEPGEIDPADRFHDDLDGESLQKLEVIVRLEKKFGVRFTLVQTESLESAAEFADAVIVMTKAAT